MKYAVATLVIVGIMVFAIAAVKAEGWGGLTTNVHHMPRHKSLAIDQDTILPIALYHCKVKEDMQSAIDISLNGTIKESYNLWKSLVAENRCGIGRYIITPKEIYSHFFIPTEKGKKEKAIFFRFQVPLMEVKTDFYGLVFGVTIKSGVRGVDA